MCVCVRVYMCCGASVFSYRTQCALSMSNARKTNCPVTRRGPRPRRGGEARAFLFFPNHNGLFENFVLPRGRRYAFISPSSLISHGDQHQPRWRHRAALFGVRNMIYERPDGRAGPGHPTVPRTPRIRCPICYTDFGESWLCSFIDKVCFSHLYSTLFLLRPSPPLHARSRVSVIFAGFRFIFTTQS